ncbi:MAG: PKD domain-containing protein [Thermoplasmata archaeon]|nr:PKD domain-containing protein [Thermoplasmata archaeon]
MRALLPLLTLFLLLPIPGSDSSGVKETAPKEWTVLIYMNGDNSLEGEAINDINEMERVGSSDSLNIIVQVDRTPGYDSRWGDWTDTRRYYIMYDGGDEALSSLRLDSGLGELDMADEKTLEDFVVWGVKTFPARHYMLVIWDHGTGILRYSRDASSFTLTRGVSSDITSGHDMEMVRAAEALSRALENTTVQEIDIIGFDLCSLGHLETAYQFSPIADYMVASFDEEPSPGWNYSSVLSPLRSGGVDPKEMAEHIVDSYADEYPSGKEYKSLAAVELRGINNITSVLSNLAEHIYNLNRSQLLRLGEIRDESHHPWRKEIYRDLGDLLLRISTDESLSPPLRENATHLLHSLQKVVLKRFLGNMHPDTAIGLGIYFPKSFFDEYYTGNILLSRTYWDEAVKRVMEPVDLKPIRINDTSAPPSNIMFEARSETPDLIRDVWVSGEVVGGGKFFKKLAGDGVYRLSFPLPSGVAGVFYHYEVVTSRYHFRFPLTGNITVRFQEDRESPVVILHPPPSPITPPVHLKVSVWDNQGIRSGGLTLHLSSGTMPERILPPTSLTYDPFSGWIDAIFTLPSDGGVYRIFVVAEDLSGNQGRFPEKGEMVIEVRSESTAILDLHHSDMRSFTSLNLTLSNLLKEVNYLSTTITNSTFEGVDLYVVVEATGGYTEKEMEALRSFVNSGGKILALLSPERPGGSEAADALGDLLGFKISSDGVWRYLLINTTFPPLSTSPTVINISGTMKVSGAGVPLMWGDGQNPSGGLSDAGLALPSSPFRDPLFASSSTIFESLLFYITGPQPPEIRYSLGGGRWLREGVYHILPGHEIGVNLTTSPQEGISYYRIEWGDGTEGMNSGGTFRHRYTLSGNFTVRMIVETDRGLTAEERVLVVVDMPPRIVVNLTPEEPKSWQWVYFNCTVWDPDGRVVRVTWDFGDGYFGEGLRVVHYYKKHGYYFVNVTAVDERGVESHLLLQLHVDNSPPEGRVLPVAYVSSKPVQFNGELLEVEEGDEVLLQVQGEDKDGDHLSFKWTMGGILVRGEYFRRYFNTSGIYDISVSAEDGMGGVWEGSVRVIVRNLPPTPKIRYEGKGKEYTFTLEGGVDSPSDVGNLTIMWDFGDGKTGEGWRVRHTYIFGGKYRVRVRVTDPEGESGEDEIVVEVPGVSRAAASTVGVILAAALFIFLYMKREQRLNGS